MTRHPIPESGSFAEGDAANPKENAASYKSNRSKQKPNGNAAAADPPIGQNDQRNFYNGFFG
jgi:hypothetical protein